MMTWNWTNTTNQELSLVFSFLIQSDSLYTYGTMAVAGLGYIIAKRGGYSPTALGVAFVTAPIFALFQKRELDYYENTTNAMYHIT